MSRARLLRLLLVSSVTAALAAGAWSCGDDDMDPQGGAGGSGGEGATGGSGATLSITTSSSGGGTPHTFTVSGVVVDQDDAPLEGALVLQGGGAFQAETGADGAFTLELTKDIPGIPTAVAAKPGYRSAGVEIVTLPDAPLTIRLYVVNPPDNALGYTYGHPGTGDPAADNSTKYCGHCHTTFAREFNTSAHARAAKNPIVHDIYAGVAAAWAAQATCEARGGEPKAGAIPGDPGASTVRCYLGVGVLPDLNGCGGPGAIACDDPAIPAPVAPTAFGACADCHGFGMDGPAGGRDLLEAEGIGYEFGVHCDACHHVRDVDLSQPPGGAGRLVLQRPFEKIGDTIDAPVRQAMFGPLPDVVNPFMGGSYQPKFTTAEFCAGCHELAQGALVPGTELAPRFAAGLPVHTTYSEWLEGPFAEVGRPCQSCHMPPVDGMYNSIDVASPLVGGIVYGFHRSPELNRSHAFRGPLTKIPAVPRLIDGAAEAILDASIAAGSLDVSVTITNVGCGHALPTGEPLRSLVLAVEAVACGEPLRPAGGHLVPDFGGAYAEGVAGTDAVFSGTMLTWPGATSWASDEHVVRVVRPTGAYWDYDGIGLFEGAQLSAAEKGIEVHAPVGEARVVGVTGDTIELDAAIAVAPGDVIYLVDSVPPGFSDGAPSRALAGSAGMAFAKLLVDAGGARGVPHHRAVDIASDNRIGPQRSLMTGHTFSLPPGCTDASVTATVLYRPHPVRLAAERGWDARDHVVVVEHVSAQP